jgi:thiol:disulfide interchange protein/DsbC/DsbD-like thiol-disulfide interchange protein
MKLLAPISPLFASFFIAAFVLSTPATAQFTSNNGSAVVTTPQVRAQLLAHAPRGVAPGQALWLGLQITHQPHWHTYWKNSGDSGLPTSLEWKLPLGLDVGEIAWPLPKKIPIGNLANYGYEDTVLLPVPVKVADNFKPGVLSSNIDIKLRAAWLVCKETCIPEEGEFALSLPAKSSTAAHGAAFDAALATVPKTIEGAHSVAPSANSLSVQASNLPAAWRGKNLEFFPESPGIIETAAKWTQAWQGDVWTAQVPLTPQRFDSPTQMPLVLAVADGGTRQGLRVVAPVQGAWPAAAGTGAGTAGANASANTNATNNIANQQANTPATGAFSLKNQAPSSFWLALFGALVGGLILNLMPCVFPVLAIKALGIAQHGGSPARQRASGLAYTAGVVLSFVALGALMLALRAGGEALGWGFQLQNPWVVAALAALFAFIGLNLSGLFEFGSLLPSRVASLQARHPVADSFLSGVLATAVASPCTAPFMGASLGFAIGLPAAQALMIFAMLGVGMALPFLLAAFVPALARALPRPGAWMDTFKKFMAFPMYATVAWLVWVLGHLSGINGAASLLVLLVALALLIWAWGLQGRARLSLGTLALACTLGVAWWLGPSVGKMQDAPTSAASAPNERWQAWAPGKVEQLLAQGQPVFVDYTAAWCVTCQYNKQTTLGKPEILQAFESKNVQLLRADWTRRDSAITAALTALGRSGVPVYVLHAPGKAPLVMSEILNAAELREAIQNL